MWTLARREISKKIRLKVGEESAKLLSRHNSMAMIVNSALGGSPSGGGGASPPKVGDPGVKDLTAGASSVEDAVAAIQAAMRF